MRGKLITLTLGIGLMLAGPTQIALGTGAAAAQGWRGGGYGHDDHRGWRGGYEHYDHNGIGAGGVILGLAAVAGVAALAASAHDHAYDRGYDPQPTYGYQDGYGYQSGYGSGDYARVAVNQCSGAAVAQARGWSPTARLGRVDAVDRRGDDTLVRGTVAVTYGGGWDRDDQVTREIGFACKFDDGRVRSLRLDRSGYGYRGG